MSRIARSGFALLTALGFLMSGAATSAGDAAAPAAVAATPTAPDGQRADTAALATPQIEQLHAALLHLMKNADSLGYNGRFEHIRPVAGAVFDMQFMASKSVGRHWQKLSAGDQTRWLDLFSRHIAANYSGQFTGYGGEVFEILGEEPAPRATRVVRTQLTRPSDEDVQLNYRLREVDGEWRVIDIYLNGTVSELALRRSEYSSVLKREGFESLMSTIDEKCQELESKSS